ncbi:MAG: hypothetical protein HOQ38_02780, partial [Nonomuraea sp.]|nr:hypothetical protein [Nonomuraea sp.]
MWFTYRVGDGDEVTGTCGRWESGPYPMAMNEFTVPEGERVTVTGRAGIWGADS